MRSKKIMKIIAVIAVTSFTLTPSLASFAEGVNTVNSTSTVNLNVQNTMKDSVLNIYNSSSKLTGTINFSSITKGITVNSSNMNEVLGNNENSPFIQMSLYKKGSKLPYKEIIINGNETASQVNEDLKGITFNYGDYLSLYTAKSVGSIKSSNVKTESGVVQNYVLTQNGLEAYGQASNTDVNTKDNLLSIYNSSNTLTGNVNFSGKTKKITVVGKSENEILGNNENSPFIQMSLYKKGSKLPYKEIIINGNETIQQVNKDLANVTFNYGDYLSLYVHTNVGTVKPKDIKNENEAVQSYVITQNGLEVYGNKDASSTDKNTSKDSTTKNNSKDTNVNKNSSIQNKPNTTNKNTSKDSDTQHKANKPFEGLEINPLNIYSTNFLTTEVVVTGRTEPNVTVNINCQNTKSLCVGKSNAEGYFAIPVKENTGSSFTPSGCFDIFTSRGWTILQQTNVFCNLTTDNPTFDVNKAEITKGSSSVLELTGNVAANQKITVNVNGQTFEGVANGQGKFSIPTVKENTLTETTPIEVSTNATLNGSKSVISKIIYPSIQMKINDVNETNSGLKYVLNGNINYLTSPFSGQMDYAKQHLPENVYNAFDKAFTTLLKYNNSDNKYKLNKNGQARVFVYYGNTGLTPNELSEIQNYLTQLPRMFLLQWGYDYAVNGYGKIVGQYFFINPKQAKGNEYQKQLMAIEPTVTRILSTIKPDMDEYQVIGQIENEFDGSLIYYDNGKYTTSETIVGALENHSAVCGGFAAGLSYLLERVGIENLPISGYTSKGGVLHAWNNVDVYGKWYIADPTWQQGYRNPALWYLVGTQDPQDIGAHIEQNTYGTMPILQKHGINYGKVMAGQKYVNLMGDTNYKINNNGTITITYNDKTKEDKNVQLNLNTNGWKAESMKNEGNGIWTATVPYKKGENLDFYFTINNLYGTAGNIKTNNLQTTVITDGINAVTVI